MSDLPFTWYLVRATGVTALVLLGGSMLVGTAMSTWLFPGRRRPAWLLEVHRWVSGLALVFLAAHLAALVADSYVHFGLVELLVPFTSSWRPVPVALGVLSMWCLVAVSATAALRRRLPRRVWLAVHRLSYVAFAGAVAHGATAGADWSNRAYQALIVLLGALGVFLVVYRLLVTEGPAGRRRNAVGGSRTEVPVAGGLGGGDSDAADGCGHARVGAGSDPGGVG